MILYRKKKSEWIFAIKKEYMNYISCKRIYLARDLFGVYCSAQTKNTKGLI
jgi:hypothetical protein